MKKKKTIKYLIDNEIPPLGKSSLFMCKRQENGGKPLSTIRLRKGIDIKLVRKNRNIGRN